MFQVGLEVLLESEDLKQRLAGRRVAYLGHPASTDRNLTHGLDLLAAEPEIDLTAGFGPQHGMRGDKQDNMIESEDYLDPRHQIPIFSLYGETRRPTKKMLESFDVLLIDLQDVGCRIYTYLTTLIYLLEDCTKEDKEVWVLDRPNPAGRPIEGVFLQAEQYSFVGAARVPMRHGLTLGELANWYQKTQNLGLKLEVVTMRDYLPESAPGFGWPLGEWTWINPSPNLSTFMSARMFCGTVLFEGTKVSEGRGTTRALEQFGAPGFDGAKVLNKMAELSEKWLKGALTRSCYFQPTFQKHAGELCGGVAIHVDDEGHYDHNLFQPFRFVSIALKAIRELYPDFELWQTPPYEYETEKMPIDMLSGSHQLREWVDRPGSSVSEWEADLVKDEQAWIQERKPFLLY